MNNVGEVVVLLAGQHTCIRLLGRAYKLAALYAAVCYLVSSLLLVQHVMCWAYATMSSYPHPSLPPPHSACSFATLASASAVLCLCRVTYQVQWRDARHAHLGLSFEGSGAGGMRRHWEQRWVPALS